MGQVGISVKRTNVCDKCLFLNASVFELGEGSLGSQNNRDSNKSALARVNTSDWFDCLMTDSNSDV